MSIKDSDSKRRLNFGHFVDRLLWALLALTGIYVSTQLKSLGDNVAILNQAMGVMLEKTSNFSNRIEHLEDIVYKRR